MPKEIININEAAKQCKTVKDVQELVKNLTKELIESMLEEEMK